MTERARWQVIVAGIAALVLSVGLARFSYTPMLPLMLDQTSLTKLQGGWLATLNYTGYLAGAILASVLPRLYDKFVLYRVGLITALVTTPAMGVTQDLGLWLVLRFVSGVSSTAGLLLASGLIMNWLANRGQKTELGLHFAGMGLGIALTGALVLGLHPALDWAAQWYAMGLIGVLCFIPAWFWMPPPAQAASRAPLATTSPEAPTGRWMRLMLAAYLFSGFGYVISATFIVDILEEFPSLQGLGNWAWVLVGAAAIPSTFVWDKVAARWGDFQALLLAYGIQWVSIVLPLVSDQWWAGLLSALLYGGTFVGIVSLTLSITGRRFPANPAKAMARMTISYGIAQIVAPALAGFIAQASGSYRGSLLLAAACVAIGMIILDRLRKHP
ncbi:MAG: YbfB/YjiJ family MFS transporter [Limnobacter sp.]|nr:YbfB/YjiJ family MFS transporter [Limnobacter sp.]